MPRCARLAVSLGVAAGCAADPTLPPVVVAELADQGCAAIYQQDVLPELHVAIDTTELGALEREFLHRAEREADGRDPTPYHPIRFREGRGETVDAMIRLKGNSSWRDAIALDADPKMQFVISFNEVDRQGRFQGLRKLELDMPRSDHSLLRQRVALFGLRRMGIPAQCANSARLFLNGTYYGLYTNLERLDKEYLGRVFPGADDGDLWKGGRFLKTNEDDFSWARLDAFWNIESFDQMPELESLADLSFSVREWAAETVLPHSDGYYMGRPNFYLYDHPTAGFRWLPHDLDTAFDYLPADTAPIFPDQAGRIPNDRQHYLLVMNQPEWREQYVAALGELVAAYDAAGLVARIDGWAAQIEDAATDDTRRPGTMEQHGWALADLQAFIPARAAYLADWLACRDAGGADSDGDGVDACYDCDDRLASVAPGAAELCNDRDDDCDGYFDEGDLPCQLARR